MIGLGDKHLRPNQVNNTSVISVYQRYMRTSGFSRKKRNSPNRALRSRTISSRNCSKLASVRRGIQSLPSTTVVQNDRAASATDGSASPPGGLNAQQKTFWKKLRTYSATRTAAPAPRLWPVTTTRQPLPRAARDPVNADLVSGQKRLMHKSSASEHPRLRGVSGRRGSPTVVRGVGLVGLVP